MIHQALAYNSDDEFVERLTPFLLEGLRARDEVIAVTMPHRLRLLRDALGGAAGSAEFIDARTWYEAPGRTLGAYHRRVLAHTGPGRLRVVGEPVWDGLDPTATAEWTRYESVINVVFEPTSAWIVCPYDVRAVPAAVLADAERTHPEIVTGGGARSADRYADPAALYDEFNRRPLPAAPATAACLDFGPGGLGAVRRFTERFAHRHGVINGRLGDYVTAINEVATNVLHHGGRQGTLRIWTDPLGLVCDVVDPLGRLEDLFLGHLPPARGAERRAGLWAARQLCDLVEIRFGVDGVTVRLHLRALPPGAAGDEPPTDAASGRDPNG